MGRPKTGTDNKLERLLTRTICQEVYLSSGLKMAELEEVFLIGAKDAWGKPTSKTFSRYCEEDPKKSRSAPRDILQRIVLTSIKKGWLTRDQIYSWRLEMLLAISVDVDDKLVPEHIPTAFAARKKERDALVKSLRDLRAAARKTSALLSSSSSIWLAMSISSKEDSFSAKRQELVDLLADVAPGLLECVAPHSVPRTLDLLEDLLEQSFVIFRHGRDSVPVIDHDALVNAKNAKAVEVSSLSDINVACGADFSDLDALLELVEKSTK